ncbi:putative carnitinyl-CoA dehydratase [Acrodontium crateriforme]|uniref:Carnitinyl-CoA dehydratase n=1 Tax=Acrodontium crateriforme TaxID=150365 RepID=A0AAQ3M2Q9_9PEZI|nr:putative carnitinyl-CoA dehydratase [Acrodontium crateriforme]
MATGKVLFQLPIAATKGKVVCTEPKPQVYLITFTSPPDNRLLAPFCQALILAFDIIETKYTPGVVITTSGIEKFYSNGLDLEHARFTPGFFPDNLYALWKRILTFPMPTVSWMNGHAFAGALMLAMMHDYRIMNPHKGFVCLNELELGAPLRPPMASIFREKLNAQIFRKLILQAARLKALEALKEGIVDSLGGFDEVLAYIDEYKLVQKAGRGMSGQHVYADLKREMYRETLGYLESFGDDRDRDFARAQLVEKEKAAAVKKVKDWEIKAKL